MLAYATTSLTSEDDDADDDDGPNLVQAAIAEDATRTAIRAVLAETRGIAVPAPALGIAPRGNFPALLGAYRRRARPVHEASPRSGTDLPDSIA